MTNTGFPIGVRNTIRARAENRCEVCGLYVVAELHHRRARGMGSTKRPETNTASNGLGTCRECHRLIEANRGLAQTGGWLVDQDSDPAETPVVYRGRRVLLDDLGNLQEAS
jgi:5-methylcytosine-specific restriction protein A